jgi:hypothetical protein
MAMSNLAGAPVTRDTVQSAIEQFDELHKRLVSILEQASGLADAVAGSSPRDASARPSEPPSASVTQRMHRQHREMNMLATEIEAELARLSSGLR